MDPSDPVRLTQDPNAGPLRDLLRAGERDLPSERQLSRLAERLEPTFAAPVAGAASPAGALAPKLLLGALGVAGIAALVFGLRGNEETQQAAPRAPTGVPVSSPVETPQMPPAPSQVPASSPVDAAATASASAATAAASSAGRVGNVGNEAARKPVLGEAALLEQARSVLGSDPARALALTRQHQTRFPNGVLKQEREVIAIEALRRLGRAQAASERAGSFERAFPDSAHRRKVETGVPK